jgi:hypothetical protein
MRKEEVPKMIIKEVVIGINLCICCHAMPDTLS